MIYRNVLLSSALLVSMTGVAAAQDDADAQEGHEFVSVDADGDGFVTEAELQAVFDEVGSDADVSTIMAAQDADGDGMISEEEAGADGRIYETQGDEDDV